MIEFMYHPYVIAVAIAVVTVGPALTVVAAYARTVMGFMSGDAEYFG